MEKKAKIYLAGHTGLVGSAILRKLKAGGFKNIITIGRQQLDLTNQAQVNKFFKMKKPEYVILAAAKVGGIHANISYPAQFIYENLSIQANVIHSSYLYGVRKLLFFSSTCAYPRACAQPMKEGHLLCGYLEPTNGPYAVAKIAGIMMCQSYNRQYGDNFICAIAANTYGPGDHFYPRDSHVIPALIRKFHEAKIKNYPAVTIWGSGRPKREFLYVDDLADASLFLMLNYQDRKVINVGTGQEISIKELTHIIKDIIGYKGKIIFDVSKPDGAPRRLLDVSRLKSLGWQAKTPLATGIKSTYDWYIKNIYHC